MKERKGKAHLQETAFSLVFFSQLFKFEETSFTISSAQVPNANNMDGASRCLSWASLPVLQLLLLAFIHPLLLYAVITCTVYLVYYIDYMT